MVAGAAEWFVGARRDSAFGPVVTVGIGGGDVESLAPVIVVAGVDAADIELRLAEATGEFGRLLAQRPHVRRPLAECAAQLAALFHAAPDLTEADVNPLMETDEGLVAVDAVFIASR
jgi:succinyl-CoA synthetase beta subunit